MSEASIAEAPLEDVAVKIVVAWIALDLVTRLMLLLLLVDPMRNADNVESPLIATQTLVEIATKRRRLATTATVAMALTLNNKRSTSL